MIYTMGHVAQSRGFDEVKFIGWASKNAQLHGAFHEVGSGELIVSTWNFDELVAASREAGFVRVNN